MRRKSSRVLNFALQPKVNRPPRKRIRNIKQTNNTKDVFSLCEKYICSSLSKFLFNFMGKLKQKSSSFNYNKVNTITFIFLFCNIFIGSRDH